MQDEGFCSHGSAQAILFGPGTTSCVIAMTIHSFTLSLESLSLPLSGTSR